MNIYRAHGKQGQYLRVETSVFFTTDVRNIPVDVTVEADNVDLALSYLPNEIDGYPVTWDYVENIDDNDDYFLSLF